jgi:adenosylmethionine-8-amino-7-oxononanoate aminotransferase
MATNQDYINRDSKYVWHPFTQEKLAPKNRPIVKGKGSWIYDADGNQYLDMISSWWVNVHGHAHPYINQALKNQADQLEHIIFAGFSHPKGIELAERIVEKLGGHFAKAFYSDNGSTANEVALKMAFQYFYNQGEQRTKVIAFNGSYHGDTFGVMSTATRNEFNEPFAPNLFDVYHIDPPSKENFEIVFQQFKKHIDSGEVAAFAFEPVVMGVAGMNLYDVDGLNRMLGYARSKGVLTIADEVFTGFYRTGKMFAIEHLEYQPDIICLSKGLTGGYLPLGMTVTTQKVYESFYSDDRLKTFFHGHSYTGNPLCCSVACASLDLFEEKETLDNIKNIEAWHHTLKSEIENHPFVQNIRLLGTIFAFDVTTHEDRSYFNTIRDELYDFFMDRMLLIRPLGNTVYILPPYCISEEEYRTGANGIVELLKYLEKKYS